jgi:multicomponent Na+:H+ antiporter subunit F
MNFLTIVTFALLLALLIPLYEAWRNENIWQTMLALTSIATKAAMITLVIAVMRGDLMMGAAGVIILSVGNAGLMLLAHILKRTNYANE